MSGGRPAVDLTGERFGRLLVLRRAPARLSADGKRTRVRWLCQCDCGNRKEVQSVTLRAGLQSSCGCAARERIIEINRARKQPAHTIRERRRERDRLRKERAKDRPRSLDGLALAVAFGLRPAPIPAGRVHRMQDE